VIVGLDQVTRSYTIGPTELRILKGVSLAVEKGDLLAIIGPSGSGKSTLMNIMGLLDKPTSGTVMIESTPVDYGDDRRLSHLRNRKIGFVFQSYQLLPRLSALENVGLPLVYRGLPDRQIREQSLEYLKRVEMAERADHRPSELSGGQQQRVAIARALAGQPALVLADEPTGALDTRVGAEIMALLKQVNEEEGVTVVVITHDPRIAASCRRSVEIRDGMLSAERA
jgi:putative ABC transport system ATP-binding protein